MSQKPNGGDKSQTAEPHGRLTRPSTNIVVLRLLTTAALLVAYVFLSATPALADETCANESARLVQNATGLPDCRGYEMVSPAAKNGGDVMSDVDKTRAASSGDAVGFASLQPFGDAIGTGIEADYISQRTAAPGTSGWNTHAITPQQDTQSLDFAVIGGLQAPLYVGEFSDDLAKGVFRSLSPLTDAPNVASTRNLYVRDDLLNPGAGSYQLLSDALAPVGPLCIFGCANSVVYRPVLAGASQDFSHIIFESRLNLTAGAVGTSTKLYEWVDGSTRLVGILPDGSVAMCDPSDTCAGAGRGASPRNETDGTISADGSKVFFTTPVTPGGSVTASSELYMRDDHGTASAADDLTVQINASEKAVPDPAGSATFGAATADGSRVFFTSSAPLTDDPTSGGSNLYEYDTTKPASDPHNLTLVSADGDPSDGASVRGVIGIDSSGQTVYFLADEKLIAGQPTITPGGSYIYRWHQGTLHYVGGLTDTDDFNTALGANYDASPRTSRVSADGRILVFSSRSGDGLTGYQHASGCSIQLSSTLADVNPCNEIYVYDAAANDGSGQLSCISCLPSGALPGLAASPVFRIGVGGSGETFHQGHFLSSDGRFVFFSTGSPLVPADKNGKVIDVYEYDTTTGQVSLISSGRGTTNSFFQDASPDGHDVFFTTRDQLVGWDTDNSYDLYDARIGGGLPNPPVPAGECSGDACQGAATPATPPPSSASSQLSGSGNLAPPAPPAAAVQPQVVKPLTRAQKLAKALKACHKKPRAQRRGCEAQARKRYGARPAKKSAAAHR